MLLAVSPPVVEDRKMLTSRLWLDILLGSVFGMTIWALGFGAYLYVLTATLKSHTSHMLVNIGTWLPLLVIVPLYYAARTRYRRLSAALGWSGFVTAAAAFAWLSSLAFAGS